MAFSHSQTGGNNPQGIKPPDPGPHRPPWMNRPGMPPGGQLPPPPHHPPHGPPGGPHPHPVMMGPPGGMCVWGGYRCGGVSVCVGGRGVDVW